MLEMRKTVLLRVPECIEAAIEQAANEDDKDDRHKNFHVINPPNAL